MKTLKKLKDRVKKNDELVISEENALDQVTLILEYYEFDFDNSDDAEDAKSDEQVIDKLILAIRKGKVEIKEMDGVPVLSQKLKSGTVLTYENNITNARANMNFDDKRHFKTTYQFAAALCGVGEEDIRMLNRADSRIAETISTFFLQL